MSRRTELRTPKATFGQAVRAEWAKLWGLRSTAYTLLVYVVLAVGLVIPVTFREADTYHAGTPAERADFAPAELATASLPAAILAVLVLGVLVVTGEYATGSIRPSLAAVPRRGWLLAAKALCSARCCCRWRPPPASLPSSSARASWRRNRHRT